MKILLVLIGAVLLTIVLGLGAPNLLNLILTEEGGNIGERLVIFLIGGSLTLIVFHACFLRGKPS